MNQDLCMWRTIEDFTIEDFNDCEEGWDGRPRRESAYAQSILRLFQRRRNQHAQTTLWMQSFLISPSTCRSKRALFKMSMCSSWSSFARHASGDEAPRRSWKAMQTVVTQSWYTVRFLYTLSNRNATATRDQYPDTLQNIQIPRHTANSRTLNAQNCAFCCAFCVQVCVRTGVCHADIFTRTHARMP